jgi:fluoride exporter
MSNLQAMGMESPKTASLEADDSCMRWTLQEQLVRRSEGACDGRTLLAPQTMIDTIMIAVGGAIGSVARYWLVTWAVPFSRGLPLGTILINILGSFAISFFGTLTLTSGRYPLPETSRLFFMVGVCGGFTTFSSFSLQTLDLLRGGAIARALINIGVSVILCLGAVALGHAAAAHPNGRQRQVAQNIIEEDAS